MASTSREVKPKIRHIYGPWNGVDLVNDPQSLDDKTLVACQNLDVWKDGSLAPRPPLRCIRRTTVTGLASAPYKVLGFDNYGSLGVAILARTTYNGTPAETGTTFELVNGAESTTKTYAAQMITGQIAPITSTDQGYYKYLWYDTKGYFLSTVSGKSFSATNLTNTATKAYLPNVPISGTDAFMFKDRMWIIAGKRVYYSKTTDPSIWAAPDGGFFDILSEDEHDPITAFAVVRDTIFFFKRNSTYQFNYSSNPGSDGYLRTVSKVMGAVNAVVYNGLVFILDVRGIYQFVNDQFICITTDVTIPGITFKFYRMMVHNDRLFCLLNPLFYPIFLVLDFNTGKWTVYLQSYASFSGTFDFTWVAINPLVDTEGADALVFANGNSVWTFSANSNLKYDAYIDSSQVRTFVKPNYTIQSKSFNISDDLSYKKLTRMRISGNAGTSGTVTLYRQSGDAINSSTLSVQNNVVKVPGFRFRDIAFQLDYAQSNPGTDDTYSDLRPNVITGYNVLPYIRKIVLDVEIDEAYGGD